MLSYVLGEAGLAVRCHGTGSVVSMDLLCGLYSRYIRHYHTSSHIVRQQPSTGASTTGALWCHYMWRGPNMTRDALSTTVTSSTWAKYDTCCSLSLYHCDVINVSQKWHVMRALSLPLWRHQRESKMTRAALSLPLWRHKRGTNMTRAGLSTTVTS